MSRLMVMATDDNSIMHRIDSRVKVVALLSYVVILTLMHSPLALAVSIIFMGLLAMVSKLPGKIVLSRLLWIIPFAGIMIMFLPFAVPGREIADWNLFGFHLKASAEGLQQAIMLLLRVTGAVLTITVLTGTTKLRELTDALRHLHVPGIMVSLMEFTIRYFFVISDELQRMRIARKARSFQAGTSFLDWHTMRTLGLMVGVLFIRSHERGERVFQAMLSRGYNGHNHCCGYCKIKTKDIALGAGMVAVALVIKVAELSIGLN